MQAVPTAKGQALADEYGIKFFETVSNLLIHIFWIVTGIIYFICTWFIWAPSVKQYNNRDQFSTRPYNSASSTLFFFSILLYWIVSYFFFCMQSAKTNLNVEQVFFSIARDIKQRLADSDAKPEVWPFIFVSLDRLYDLSWVKSGFRFK